MDTQPVTETLNTNLFTWRVSQHKNGQHESEVNKQLVLRPRLRLN
jgi:hypothetical protein